MSPPADKAGEPGALGEITPALDHYPNGNARFRGFHLDGEMHGEWTFYRADGSVMRTGAFDRAGTAVKVTDFGPAGEQP